MRRKKEKSERLFMRWLRGIFPVLALLPLAGCSFLSGSYREPEVFDPPAAAGREAVEMLPECTLGAIRNFSGADRRFLFRSDPDGRMESDEYSRWLLPPDQMLERQLRETALVGRPAESGGRDYLQLGAEIRRFEFNKTTREALLEVEFIVRVFRDRRAERSVSEVVRCVSPFAGGSAAECAAAMTQCFHTAAEAARNLLLQQAKVNHQQISEP